MTNMKKSSGFKAAFVSAVRTLLLPLLLPLSLALVLGGSHAATVTANDREAMTPLTINTFKKFSQARRKQVQQALLDIYKDQPDYMKQYGESSKPLSDDIIGPITLSWLNRFCADFKIVTTGGDLTDEAMTLLFHFAEIAKAHPTWKTILLSENFTYWIERQPEPKRSELYKLRLSGTAQQIIWLLNLYQQDPGNQGGKASGLSEGRDSWTVYAFQLNADDFKLLLAKSQAIQQLAALENEAYGNKQQLAAAVKDALKDMDGQVQQLLPMVVQYAETASYQLTESSFQKLKIQAVPDEVLQPLQAMKDIAYAGQAELIADVKTVTKNIAAQFAPYQSLVVQEAATSSSYLLTEASLNKMKADPRGAIVPATILDMLKEIQGVSYPAQTLFDKAALAKMFAGIDPCPQNASTYTKTSFPDLRISAEAFQALKGVIPEALFNQLDKYRNLKVACTDAEMADASTQVDHLYAPYQASIGTQAKKMPAYDSTKKVQWSGGSCGCVLDRLSGVVYGFYPFWLAGEKQQIDFSMLSRVGYYSLSFDEQGNLKRLNAGMDSTFTDGAAADNEFVGVANKFRTKVDWVIHKSDWSVWSTYKDAKKAQVLEQLANNLVKLLNARLTDFPSRAIPYVSLGLGTTPTQGDGVTLFFEGYPEDAGSVVLFDKFVETLKGKLNASGGRFAVNMLVYQSAMGVGKGIYDYQHLLNLINLIEAADKKQGMLAGNGNSNLPRVAVLIEEPTTDSKKKLRKDIEDALHGADREYLLRRIIPVIEFDGKSWRQLEDDVIYFKDSFGGIGFWPLSAGKQAPAADADKGGDAGAVIKSVEQTLLQQYQQPDAKPASMVCKIVCPNRWAFRITWDIFFACLVLSGLFYFWNCRWQALLQKYTLYYIGAVVLPTFALGMMLLSCDPFLAQLSKGNWPFILLFVGIVAYSVWRYLGRKADADIP